MYIENQLVGIAKRENNKKRKYLVVNKYQGKHIPVSPCLALDMFGALADQVENVYRGKRLLLIGFAETATAIGAAVAGRLDCHYIQTTREVLRGAKYLYFSEAHSHASEQKLIKNHLEGILCQVQRIIFLEDEITTGNTILDVIGAMEQEYGKELKFSVASILNGMNEEDETRFRLHGIEMHYLVKTCHECYEKAVEHIKGDGGYEVTSLEEGAEVCWQDYEGGLNPRKLVKSQEYQSACHQFWKSLKQKISWKKTERILVLGTEEFMYPALYVASKLEGEGCSVKFHATTRSPIVTSLERGYPLHQRYELRSLYDSGRTTYIYELATYDRVMVITDADREQKGWTSLKQALELCGNKQVDWIRWREN